MTRILGHVRALNRYPVKSMAGEQLGVAELDWQGIEGDRQYAFVRSANGTRFPWLTAREVPSMVLHRARFADPGQPKKSAVLVETPDGALLSLHDPLLKAHLELAAGEPAALIQVARGIYDSMPVSIQTTASHAALEAAHGMRLDPQRFRSNVMIESDVPSGALMAMRLAFGHEEDGAIVQCADPIARCVVTTIDPDTGAKEPRVLRTVAQAFGNSYGIYAGPARPGLIRLGDVVRALD
jgi:uncharacterized protein